MKLSEAMDYAADYATVGAQNRRELRMPFLYTTEALARLRAEVNRLQARLERAEELRRRDLAALGGECERLTKRVEETERERDEARQTIGALEKSAAKYEAWVDENMRMI